jgi:hypothetical protein
VLAWSAALLAEVGRVDEGRAALDELIATAGEDGADVMTQALVEASVAAETVGRRESMRHWLGPAVGSVWTPTARAVLDGDYDAALSELEPRGSIYLASLIRLRADEHLVREGRRKEAEAMLQRAIAFFESVGATRYLRTAEALLAA